MTRPIQRGSVQWRVRECVREAGKSVTALYVSAETGIDTRVVCTALTTLWRHRWVDRLVGNESNKYEYTPGPGPGARNRETRLELVLRDLLGELHIIDDTPASLRAAIKRASVELHRTMYRTRAAGRGNRKGAGGECTRFVQATAPDNCNSPSAAS